MKPTLKQTALRKTRLGKSKLMIREAAANAKTAPRRFNQPILKVMANARTARRNPSQSLFEVVEKAS